MALSNEQIQILMIAEGDQAWVKNVSEYKNVKEQIREYQKTIEESDFFPKDEEEKRLFALFYGWLQDLGVSPGNSFVNHQPKQQTERKVIRIISYGDDDGTEDENE